MASPLEIFLFSGNRVVDFFIFGLLCEYMAIYLVVCRVAEEGWP
jgi:hypothetical protein